MTSAPLWASWYGECSLNSFILQVSHGASSLLWIGSSETSFRAEPTKSPWEGKRSPTEEAILDSGFFWKKKIQARIRVKKQTNCFHPQSANTIGWGSFFFYNSALPCRNGAEFAETVSGCRSDYNRVRLPGRSVFILPRALLSVDRMILRRINAKHSNITA